MSQQSPPSAHSTTRRLLSNPATALLEQLEEVVQALLALSREEGILSSTTPEGPKAPPKSTGKTELPPDQIRCYRVPGFIVQDEREALREYRAEDLRDLLERARSQVSLTSFLLRHFTPTRQ